MEGTRPVCPPDDTEEEEEEESELNGVFHSIVVLSFLEALHNFVKKSAIV